MFACLAAFYPKKLFLSRFCAECAQREMRTVERVIGAKKNRLLIAPHGTHTRERRNVVVQHSSELHAVCPVVSCRR